MHSRVLPVKSHRSAVAIAAHGLSRLSVQAMYTRAARTSFPSEYKHDCMKRHQRPASGDERLRMAGIVLPAIGAPTVPERSEPTLADQGPQVSETVRPSNGSQWTTPGAVRRSRRRPEPAARSTC